MKRIFYILFFLVGVSPAMGQFNFSAENFCLDSNQIMKFGFNSEAFANSNVLNAKLVNAVLFGGYISQQERQNMVSKAGSFNNEGAFWNNSFYFSSRIDSFNLSNNAHQSYWMKFSSRTENFGTFSTTAMEYAFFGNKPYRNTWSKLAPLGGSYFAFQQIQVGYLKEWKSNYKFGVGASFLIGNSYQNLQVDELNIKTTTKGDSIYLESRMSAYSTPSGDNYFQYNGAGMSIDLWGAVPFDLLKDSSQLATLNVQIIDLGFVNYFGSGTHFAADTSYVYTGTTFTNIFDPGAKIYNNNPNEILDSLSTKTNKEKLLWLPTTINAQLTQPFGSWQTTIGTTFRNNAYFRPYFYVKAHKSFSNHITIGGQLNHGGYGNLGGGLEFSYKSNGYKILVGASNIEGFIAPSKTAGTGIYLNLSKAL